MKGVDLKLEVDDAAQARLTAGFERIFPTSPPAALCPR
jgi:hypothetical protein